MSHERTASASSPIETEVKIRIEDVAAVCQKIEQSGFEISQPREFEANTLYDTAAKHLLGQQMLLRLRTSGSKQVLTWKGPALAGPHKSRPEIETSVGSVESLAGILKHLGYEPAFRYEKYRREYRRKAEAGVITVDETPIGAFLELEGPAEWIDEAAKTLGFLRTDYVLDSYARLYLKDCERRGVAPGFMVFSSE
jgi:adenylate cyclase class 2